MSAMAVQNYADQMLAAIAPLWPEFHLWYVPTIYSGTTWHARRVGEATASVNANSPEELIGKLQELTG